MVARNIDDLNNVKKSMHNSDRHLLCELDLLKIENIKQGLENCGFDIEKVNVVVHSAGGGLGARESLISPVEFHKLLALNLSSAIEINRIIIPGMKKANQGNIVHVGSIASYEAVGSVGYNTVKAGYAVM